jgi:hypothetical protein
MTRPELVVFSHLPWNFVWQRPPASDLAPRGRASDWFVEECRVVAGLLETPRVCVRAPPIPSSACGYEVGGPPAVRPGSTTRRPASTRAVESLLAPGPPDRLGLHAHGAARSSSRLDRSLLVYDVMDDLGPSRSQSPAMRDNQDRLLAEADLVFTAALPSTPA